MHVLILYDAPAHDAGLDGLDVLEQVRHVETGLSALGHSTARLGLGADVGAAAVELAATPADLVFNLVESFAGRGRLIHLAPTLCEALGRAYTGASAEAIFATSNKLVAKRLLAAAGLPTPAWHDLAALERGVDVAPGAYIVKSVWEHASIGLDEDSVVVARTAAELAQEVRARLPALGRAGFAERYVDGREFNLALIADGEGGPRVLPPAEIVFEGYGADKPRVVGYRAKWEPDSYEYSHTPRRFDFPPGDADLLSELDRLARAAWELFDLAGWARVDFRVDPAGRPWVLEVNTNPCLSPDAGFAAALEHAGMAQGDALKRILTDAARRRADARRPDPRGEAVSTQRSRADTATSGYRSELTAPDVEAVRSIVASTGFFSPAEIDVAVELAEDRLARGSASDYQFLFPDQAGAPRAYACYGLVAATEGSFDLYWIAVHADDRGRGVGRRLLAAVEEAIATAGGERIWVETSSRDLYEPTRAFYRASGYEEAARMEDFYARGDAKVVFVKRLPVG